MNTQLKGITYITLSAFFFGTYGVWSRLIGDSFGNFFQAWSRGLFLLIILIPFALWKKQIKTIQKEDLVWFIAMALAGGLNQAPYFYAFHHLDIGTATLLFYASLTIGCYVIGKLFFNERMTFIKYLSLFLALLGMSMIFSFSLSGAFLATIAAVIAGFMGATVVSLSKKVSSSYSPLFPLLCDFLVMFLANSVISLLIHEQMIRIITLDAVIGALGYAITMVFANVLAIIGFRYTTASIGGLIGLSEILFAALFGLLFFGQHPGNTALLGGTLIIAAAALPNLPFGRKDSIDHFFFSRDTA